MIISCSTLSIINILFHSLSFLHLFVYLIICVSVYELIHAMVHTNRGQCSPLLVWITRMELSFFGVNSQGLYPRAHSPAPPQFPLFMCFSSLFPSLFSALVFVWAQRKMQWMLQRQVCSDLESLNPRTER